MNQTRDRRKKQRMSTINCWGCCVVWRKQCIKFAKFDQQDCLQAAAIHLKAQVNSPISLFRVNCDDVYQCTIGLGVWVPLLRTKSHIRFLSLSRLLSTCHVRLIGTGASHYHCISASTEKFDRIGFISTLIGHFQTKPKRKLSKISHYQISLRRHTYFTKWHPPNKSFL